MEIAKLIIGGLPAADVIDYLTQSVLFDYIDIADGVTVLAKEEFYLRTGSDHLDLLIIKSVGEAIRIDIIGGGGAGLLHLSFASDSTFVKKTVKLIKAFCEAQGATAAYLE